MCTSYENIYCLKNKKISQKLQERIFTKAQVKDAIFQMYM